MISLYENQFMHDTTCYQSLNLMNGCKIVYHSLTQTL